MNKSLFILVPLVVVGTLAVHKACNPQPETAATGTGEGAPAEPTGPLAVYTTFYPTTYFASQIAQGHADVLCPVPADADPIFWQPDDASIAAYQAADLIVVNGASFEKWVGTVTLPPGKVVDTAAPFADQLVRYANAITHSHGEGGEHSHEGIDGHTWLDPLLAKVQAAEIRDALKQRLPAAAADLDANYDALATKFDDLHTALDALPKDQPLLASHPAYNYLVKRYGWNMENLDLDPQEEPTEAQLLEIQVILQEHPAKLILWESEPSPANAELLNSQFGLTSITVSPGESPPETGDYLTLMQANLQSLQSALSAP